jgi:NADP-dependent aldehyde dehydrogenase
MLTPGMAAAHESWARSASTLPGVTVHAGEAGAFTVEATVDALDPALLEEHFGPTAVLVRAPVESYAELAERLAGTLTATLVGTDADAKSARALLPALAARAGRIIWNGMPTGVAVVDAMHHGGPWPATSASWSTSVGTGSIRRFLRPVALQGLPPALFDAVSPDAGEAR